MITRTTQVPEAERYLLGKEPFKLKHELSNHPLLELPRLLELAVSMPPQLVEYNAGTVDISQNPAKSQLVDHPVADVISDLEHANAWLAILHAERDPAYKELLDQFLEDLAGSFGQQAELFQEREAYIFLSSPGSITPFHTDPELNVLTQIKGIKTFHVFNDPNHELVGVAAREAYPGKHRNQPYVEEFEQHATRFRLGPGEALHIPHGWPHWVQVDDGPSISVALTWKTPEVQRTNKLLQVNYLLRRAGLPQPYPSGSGVPEEAKLVAYRAGKLGFRLLKPVMSPDSPVHRMVFGSKDEVNSAVHQQEKPTRLGAAKVRLRLMYYWVRGARDFRLWHQIEDEDGFDRRYGTETSKRHPTINYGATPVRTIENVLRDIPDGFKSGSFVDLGSGKGRAVLLASQRDFSKVIGVEHNARMHRIALDNLQRFTRYNSGGSPVDLRCQDAIEFVRRDWPDQGPVVLFLFSPFPAHVLSAVFDHLRKQLESTHQPLAVGFVNPGQEMTRIAESWPGLELVQKVEPEDGSLAGYEHFSIFLAGTEDVGQGAE